MNPTVKSPTYVSTQQKIVHLLLKDKQCIAEILDEWSNPFMYFDPFHQVIVKAIIETYRDHQHLLTADAYRTIVASDVENIKGLPLSMEVFAKCDIGAYAVPDDLPVLKKELYHFWRLEHQTRAIKEYADNIKTDPVKSANRLMERLDDISKTTARKLSVAVASSITTKKVQWLWQGRIPLGKTTLLSGEGGVGKGAMIADIMAKISNGFSFPFCTGQPIQGKCMILSAEDDASDTIVPRLIAAGANLDNCIVIDEQGITLDKHLSMISAQLKANPDIKLLVIDPISAYLGETREEECPLRAFLMPIEKMAAEHGIAVILIKHFKKGKGAAKEKVSGSIAWINAVRTALGVAQDRENQDLKHLFLIKSNIARLAKSISFETVSSPHDPDIVKVEWKEQTDYVADDFTTDKPETKSTTQEASAWLTNLLISSGPMLSDDVITAGQNEGFSRCRLFDAKKQAGIRARKRGMVGGWEWYVGAVVPATNGDGNQGKIPDSSW